MGTVIIGNRRSGCMITMLGQARKHIVVPKPIKPTLLAWCLAAGMSPPGDSHK